jgi:hypothetical protein
MDRKESQWEWLQTKSLFFRFVATAVGVPAFAFLILWLYTLVAGETLERREWKTTVLIFWIGTLVVLAWAAFSSLAEQKGLLRSWTGREEVSNARQSSSWELKKTKTLYLSLFAAAIGVPLASIAVVWASATFLGMVLGPQQWRTAALVIWAGTLIMLFRISRKAAAQRIIYRRKE